MSLTNLQANLTLDVYDHDGRKPSIKAIALDDDTRYVLARLTFRGDTYDIGSSATVQLIVIRPDKAGVQISGSAQEIVIGVEDETPVTVYGAYAELDQAAIALPGTLLGQFKLTSGEQILRTQIFNILNGEALDSDTWAGDYDGYNLDELVQTVNDSNARVGTLETDVAQIKEDLQDIDGVMFQTTDNLLDFTDASLWVRKDLDGVTRHYAVTTANKIPVEGGSTIYTALKDLSTDIFGTTFNIRLQQYDANGEKVGTVKTGSSITSTAPNHITLDASTTHIFVCLNTNNYQKTFTIAQLVEMNPLIYVGTNSAITNDTVYRHNVSIMEEVQSNISALQSDADNTSEFINSYHQTINLFNPSAVLNGKYMRTENGELKYSLHQSYHTTDFIPVSAGDTLIASRDGVEVPAYSYAYFDTDKTWLRTLYGNVVLVNANPAPQDGFIRISFHDDYYDADRMMVEITTRMSASPFVPYGKVGITYDDIEPRLSAVEDELSAPIKELFKAEADATVESVISAITSKAVIFSITTDEHYKDITADANTLTSMFRDSCRNIKYVNDKVKSDMVISLGDRNCDAEGEHDERLTTQAEMIKWLRSTNDKTFAIIGNHDFNGSNYANVISDAELYAVTQRYNEDYVERDGITDNAYIDFPFAKVRAIFYNSFYNNGSAIIMSLGLAENKTWLANVALNTPDDYAVVFMTHSPIKQGFGTDTIYGGTDVIGILNAYATQSTYTDSANGTVYDFTGKSGTKVACAICGHVHDDNVYRDSNLTFPFVCIGCGKFENGNPVSTIGTPTKPTRKRGTVSSDLWDTVVILPEERKVKFIRFGAGEDREVTYD